MFFGADGELREWRTEGLVLLLYGGNKGCLSVESASEFVGEIGVCLPKLGGRFLVECVGIFLVMFLNGMSAWEF